MVRFCYPKAISQKKQKKKKKKKVTKVAGMMEFRRDLKRAALGSKECPSYKASLMRGASEGTVKS